MKLLNMFKKKELDNKSKFIAGMVMLTAAITINENVNDYEIDELTAEAFSDQIEDQCNPENLWYDDIVVENPVTGEEHVLKSRQEVQKECEDYDAEKIEVIMKSLDATHARVEKRIKRNFSYDEDVTSEAENLSTLSTSELEKEFGVKASENKKSNARKLQLKNKPNKNKM